MHFRGIFKITQIFERWDDANKMQIRQLDKAELIRSKEIGNKKVLRRNKRTLKMAK